MRGIISILSFLFVIGTAGALELDNITIGQAIIRSVIGLTIFYISSRKYMKWKENYIR